MKKKWIHVGAVCLVSASLLAGCGSAREAGLVTAGSAAQEVKPIAVSIAEVKEGVLTGGSQLLGEISPKVSVNVVAKLSGTLASLSVQKGEMVKQGQVIARLDQTDYVLGVKQAQASLNTAQASLAQAQAGVSAAKASLAQAQAAVETATSSLNQAKSTYGIKAAGNTSYEIAQQSVAIAQANYDRVKSLVDAGAASKTQLEQAESALLQAKTLMNQSAQADAQGKGAINTAKTSVKQAQVSADKTAKAAVQQAMGGERAARAGVQQAQVGLEKARTALNDTVIKAPITGIISFVGYETGELVSPQQAVATIININPVLVKINVSESMVVKFTKGALMDVEIPALGKTVKGKVTYRGIEADRQSKMFPIELEIPNPDGVILPGMKVNVLGVSMNNQKGLLVPADAIIEKDGKKSVYIVEGTRAIKRAIVTAEGNSTHVLVVSGLKSGDKVVVKGQSQLKDQAQVRIVQ
ncbi:efflux RND transporter periplasmic adaptor subunit [Aneurinibacillus danicus]|jgi:RND family efflux transporter MFP subunit|uniref:Lipoprotein n=1 Tax=Aneurinibacillus danicus TaxID=267746 RepID=A0A511VAE3_9BACL|nr:efflux RND transporter periplasmic adaptor subunit [Aneurinibacillus danicus]GEN35900.1 lipoprotein [Aneurinibacillus danicus]